MTRSRRVLAAAATFGLVAVGTIVATASPAAADQTIKCTKEGSWGVLGNSSSGAAFAFLEVYANTDCSDPLELGPILEADVFDDGSTYDIEVHDYKSDGTGMTLHLHLTGGRTYNLNSLPAADNAAEGTVKKSDILAPLNFWVRIGGAANSPALNLP